MSDIENRVMELEIKNAHQEDTIEQLNHIIIEHQNSIGTLIRQLKQIQNKVSSLQENGSQSKNEPEPPPPHY
ncbi:MAG: SlyX family protein [Gammaproteobacteria bacterium]|nr:SlyX family protein [Gammaproteobacteria bacterium]